MVPASAAKEAGRAATDADSVPRSIAEAESPGAHTAHTAERKCFAATGYNPARSGDISARGFDIYNDLWTIGYGKIAWETPNATPGAAPAPLMTVRATRLDPPGATRVFDVHAVEQSTAGNTLFYPSGIHLPTSGTWMLVATAGPNWGCFLHTVD
jgi:hypothetical protein